MSTSQSIRAMIQNGETDTFATAESVNQDSVGKTICGFLNGSGGKIYIGVNNNGKIIGIRNVEEKKNQLKSFLSSVIIPEAPIEVSIKSIDGQSIIIADVWEGGRKPYVFKGFIYFRRAAQTIPASSAELSELLHDREQSDLHWERKIVTNFGVEDLDQNVVVSTIKAIHDYDRAPSFSENKTEDFLAYYGLSSNGRLTNAAVVLFAKNPSRYFPQIRIRFAVLEEGKTGSGFKIDRVFEGNLFDNLKKIEDLLHSHLKLEKKIDKVTWKRTDGYQYPMDAISEGVLNAMIHRDYSRLSGSISILVFTDRIEISNPGELPFPVAELRRSHLSMPQNPDIAHICFLHGFIDKIGRGTVKIIKACKEAGLPEPKWKAENFSVKLTFFNGQKSRNADQTNQFQYFNELFKKVNEGVNKGLNKGANKEMNLKIEGLIEGVTEGVTEGVKGRIKLIIALIANQEGLNTQKIARFLNIPVKSLERYIRLLRDDNLVEFQGASRSGGYYLSKEARKKILS